MVNPLIDEIFYLLLEQPVWKVHTLTSALSESGKIEQLDNDPQKDLFKRNFLVMNALYQLQTQLAPEQQLQIASLHIELVNEQISNALENHDPLRDYYLDWQNYDTTSDEIDAMLTDFWQRFSSYSPKRVILSLSQQQLLELQQAWQLPTNFSEKQLQKRWRQLALKHHPDRQGCAIEFKKIQLEYEQLKASCS
ncbi:DnaJ domain-containing protein [Pseudoalteromonas shioyasakiensis]|uniref:DNA-J related domain-containing protein n=1 Tax=Pseudoalteromonas sp. Isolate3 TaxID=2908526 RepID=UPI001C77D1C9|nr:DNA-J related domain-containing protein [Pseudoalteromonas sp. Isolate3]MCG9707599.1 DnaJ domain-containing protein [Pseudoalteromonas sp. Isolate3]QWV04658.1 DnaJ domain-containing protein [Pseudoalteromonas shioyasakiensis]